MQRLPSFFEQARMVTIGNFQSLGIARFGDVRYTPLRQSHEVGHCREAAVFQSRVIRRLGVRYPPLLLISAHTAAMAYSHDYQISARRHFKAAETLYVLNSGGAQPGAKAVAGYLYGLAGELAVKQMMIQSGMRPLASDQRRDDPFYKHFPELKTFLQSAANGRRSGELLSIARTAQIFREWSTDMRYAPTLEVSGGRVDGWQGDAKKLIGQMEEH
ncbi:hypothetical protein WI82_10600 [Burkholderia ubonensis]|nr:hypothetical protein WI82_10600 [Burkholderia ubonensis]